MVFPLLTHTVLSLVFFSPDSSAHEIDPFCATLETSLILGEGNYPE